jgi:predicted MFS family arabinose efflux permease
MSAQLECNSSKDSAGLYRNSDFLKFWSGQTISLFGSQVTTLALPLTAAITLQATPMQMGVLGAIQYAPSILLGLFFGVWVDRLRRRPILMFANVARGLLLGVIPLAALLGVLRIEQLFVLAFLTGSLTACFDVAYLSYLPTLIGRAQAVDGNSKLQISNSTAAIVGPGLAGVLVQWLTAPLAIAVDAASFFISAVFLSVIRKPEAPPSAGSQPQSIWKEIGEGWRLVLSNPIMRTLMVGTATSNFFINVQIAVRVIFVTRDLQLQPATLGFMFATGSLGGLMAAFFAKRISRVAGIGPTLIAMQFLVGISALVLPLASGGYWMLVLTIVPSIVLWGFAMMTYDINHFSFRQTVTPDRLQGRMTASIRLVTGGVALPGALLGGVLGGAVGLRTTLLVGGIGILSATLWTFFSPTRHLGQIPAEMIAEEPEAATSIDYSVKAVAPR